MSPALPFRTATGLFTQVQSSVGPGTGRSETSRWVDNQTGDVSRGPESPTVDFHTPDTPRTSTKGFSGQ